MAERIERHNRDFSLSYHSWFESVYKDKYDYMGEWDLMSIAFRLDLGLYYLGVVSQPFKSVRRRFFHHLLLRRRRDSSSRLFEPITGVLQQ